MIRRIADNRVHAGGWQPGHHGAAVTVQQLYHGHLNQRATSTSSTAMPAASTAAISSPAMKCLLSGVMR